MMRRFVNPLLQIKDTPPIRLGHPEPQTLRCLVLGPIGAGVSVGLGMV